MKRMIAIILITCLFLCGCQANEVPTEPDNDNQMTENNDTQTQPSSETPTEMIEADEPDAVVRKLFEGYAVADYESMKPYCTDSAIEKYFHEGDVFGNATAEILDITSIEQESEKQVAVLVLALIDPVPTSSVYGQSKTSFYVRLILVDSQWKVNEFVNGL